MTRSANQAKKTTLPLLVPAGIVAAVILAGSWLLWSRHRLHDEITLALKRPSALSQAHPEFRAALDKAMSAAVESKGAAELGKVATLYHANGYPEPALRIYRVLAKLEPGNPLWPHLSGSILGGFGALDEAMPLLERTVGLAPAYVPARLRLADALFKLGKGDLAEGTYRQVLALDPVNAFARLGLARIEIAAGRWSDARAHLHEIIERAPAFQGAWTLLPSVNEKLGMPVEKQPPESPEAASAQREMPDPWLDALADDCFDSYRVDVYADAAKIAGDDDRALRLYQRAVALAPRSAAAHRILGTYLLKAKRPAEARGSLEQAVALDPRDSGNWSRLVLACNLLGDKEASAKALEDGLKHCPDSPGMRLEQGRRLAEKGQTEAALAEFLESRRLRPTEPQAYLDYAMVCFRTGQTKRGVTCLRELLVVAPFQPFALLAVGKDAIDEGNEKEARDLYRRLQVAKNVGPEFTNRFLADFRAKFGSAP